MHKYILIYVLFMYIYESIKL